MATQLTSIVESSQAERLATGFVFTEGPLWHPDGHWLFVNLYTPGITLAITGPWARGTL